MWCGRDGRMDRLIIEGVVSEHGMKEILSLISAVG